MDRITDGSLTGTWLEIAHPVRHEAIRRTKIVCTLGPSTSTPAQILALGEAGMDVARLNLSFGSHEEHRERLATVRDAGRVLGRPIAVLADLCGPKIRVVAETAPVEVHDDDILVLTGDGGREGDVRITFPELAASVHPGDALLIEDGRIRTRVVDVDGRRVRCVVEVGGTVRPGKGVNLPDTSLPIPSLTDKDRVDLRFALTEDVDLVALSFVRSATDIAELREAIDEVGSPARIVAKVEKAEAVTNLAAIIEASDAVMVARGDLGVEIGTASVPLVQKHMISAARRAGRTVITATQMLESMIDAPEPTRAEASDVANAILDGTSAVMLSAETAAGRYPFRAVAVMDSIARSVEPELPQDLSLPEDPGVSALIAETACRMAEGVDAAVIAVKTRTGQSAREASRFRPHRPIVAATSSEVVLRQLALEWGVVPLLVDEADSLEASWGNVITRVVDEGLAEPGDSIVLIGRAALPVPGVSANVVLHRLDAIDRGTTEVDR